MFLARLERGEPAQHLAAGDSDLLLDLAPQDEGDAVGKHALGDPGQHLVDEILETGDVAEVAHRLGQAVLQLEQVLVEALLGPGR